MNSDLPPIPGAVLPINFDAYNTVQQSILVDGSQFTNLLETVSLFSRTRHPYIHGEDKQNHGIAELLNTTFDHFTMQDSITWFLSPVSWRDPVAEGVATRFLKDHQMWLRVNLAKVLRQEKLLGELETTCLAMEFQTGVRDPRGKLMALETLHKSITLYMWMGQRMPVVFADREEALELKEKVEKAMEFVLQGMTKGVSAKRVAKKLKLTDVS